MYDDIPVNAATIEKRLADLWREEQQEEDRAVTKAALWNVIAHTWTSEQHAFATQVLGCASAAVPQRTIVIRADPRGSGAIQSYISANCHLIGAGRQVCSEEVAIIASGERVHHVPPLVSALLLPDMPVAVWWVGDLPSEQHKYVETLLDPADRLIVDSAHFNSAADFELVSRIAQRTTTAPADLNWARIDEWRAATAALFDPPAMRERLGEIARVRIVHGSGDSTAGARSEAVLYLAWLIVQTGEDVAFELTSAGSDAGIASIDLDFDDGSTASIRVERERGVVISSGGGMEIAVDCVTRAGTHELDELIVRLLKRPESDLVYLKSLPIARAIAARAA
ncbi:MAG TPA: glucose-6-phosphate dehydrogenase assembly protein OpcA [Thermoanaerobaculia bacterium]|nr:glucose-6-phosphate dehydrogenase assembly protein OpcA [Thermoanaerobaculia bacterium]